MRYRRLMRYFTRPYGYGLELRTGVVAFIIAGLIGAVGSTQSPNRPPSGSSPGWKIRIDRSTSAADPDAPGPVKFVATATGFRATNPQAAVFWNPASAISASYSVSGTFTLLTPSNHTNYYGLVFGGTDLDGPAQRYVYFLVAQDGTWLVKRRDGDEMTETILTKTPSSSVRTPDVSGRSINTLEARITPTAIVFTINGTVVNTWYGAGRVIKTDGIYGIRVNHFLDVQVDRLAAVALPASTRSPSLDANDEPGRGSETVAITGAVRRVLSPTVFVIAQPNGKDATVVARALQHSVERNAMVTAFGRTISPGETRERRAGITAISGNASIVSATSVLTADMVDLTKRLPPPATAEEEALDGIMKRISPAFTALRAAVETSKRDETEQRASTLQQAFSEVEAFWAKQSRGDALGWARTGRIQSAAIVRAAAGDTDWASIKASTDALGQQCQACHSKYREAFDDGLFRIRNPDR